MIYHEWGDDFDWKALNKAMDFIYNYVKNRSGSTVIMKEKYGTIRYEFIFIPGTSVRLENYLTLSFFKKKTKFGELPIIIWRWRDSFIAKLWFKYTYWLLDRAVRLACDKFPTVKEEILSDYRKWK